MSSALSRILTASAPAATRPVTLQLAAPSAATSSPSAREITGLCVPYGPAGNSSVGQITFASGSIALPETIGRVKLLLQHDPERVLGYATSLTDTPEGLLGTFAVAEGPAGDLALQEVADGRRDGLSVGVRLSDESYTALVDKLWDGDTSPTAVSGALLEVSQVSIPAFEDARTDGSAAAALEDGRLLTLAVDFRSTPTPHVGRASARSTQGEPVFTAAQLAALAAAGIDSSDVAAATAFLQSLALSQAQASTPPAPSPAPLAGAAAPTAAAGSSELVRVLSEPSVYAEGNGQSMVRDAWRARMDGNYEAAQRLQRFRAEIDDIARAAVATRPNFAEVIPPGYRGDLLISAVDRGRPIIAQLQTAPLTDATPFRIPIEGEFEGVAEHVEGTPHAAEGTLDLDEVTISPTAVSGAFRVSREMVDSSNPALDTIAQRAMLRDYRRKSNAKLVAALESADPVALVAADGAAYEDALVDFLDDAADTGAFGALSRTYFKALAGEELADGRKRYPYLSPANASGTTAAGFRALDVQGVPTLRDNAVDQGDAWLIDPSAVFWGESTVLQFRFDEVEGPGVIKLALWAYSVAKVTRPVGVQRLALV